MAARFARPNGRDKMVEKYIKDGVVGVLYSPGFGAGWSTWNNNDLAFDADLVKAFVDGGKEAVIKVADEKYPDIYKGGLDDIEIEWVPQGTAFRINEYDGSESIEYIGDSSYMTA
jgi:hypothetical protein